MTLNGVMAVTLRYFTEFGKPCSNTYNRLICSGIYARVYCILYCVYDVVIKKSSRSLFHLLMSFLYILFQFCFAVVDFTVRVELLVRGAA